MADTIHKKKKNWPHFDKIHLGSEEYAEGWERIFGSKNGKKKYAVRRGRQVQEVDEPVETKRRKKSKSTRRVDRSQEIRQEKIR